MSGPRRLTAEEARRLHEMLDELEAQIGDLAERVAELKEA